MSISSIPTSRVSDSLMRERLMGQVQSAQVRLLQLQQQISTGQRFLLASDDPTRALQGIAVRSLLQRKDQSKTNLTTASGFLSATDSALSGVSSLLDDARTTALGSIGSSATDSERQTAANSISLSIDRLLQLSNQNYRGRYLFSGEKTSTPSFAWQGNYIAYQGGSGRLQTYADFSNLIDSNVTGDEALGALSSEVQGSVTLDPSVNETTPLSQLRGGRGVSPGSLVVSDGVNTSIVNIAGAVTLGDVARLLEKYPPGWDRVPPTGRTLTAHVGSHGLEITLNGGNLSISELAGGTTAGELGLRTLGGVGTGPFIGGDVNALVTRTTSIQDLFGTRTRAYLTPTGLSNDIIVESRTNGTALNNVKVKLLDDGKLQAGAGLIAGNEVASYLTTATAAKAILRLPGASNDLQLTANTSGEAYNDVKVDIVNGGSIGNNATASYSPGSKTLTLTIDGTGATQIGTLIAAVNSTGVFTATRDTTGSDPVIDNTAPIAGATFGANITNSYNTGSNANTLVVRIEPGVTTANQVIAAINSTAQFSARLDASEANNLGTNVVQDAAVDAGAVAVTSGGSGQNLDPSGIRIVNGGQAYSIAFTGAKTVDDLLNQINTSGAGVVAEINASGTGIDVRSLLSGSDLSIGENGGTTATQLGIRSYTTDTALNSLNYGAGVRTTGNTDFTITRRDGVTISPNLQAGTYATASINGSGANDAMIISSATPGTAGNQYSVAITDSGSGGASSVTLVGNTLTFSADLSAGFTANSAAALLAGSPLHTQFVARLDTSADPSNNGTGNLAATSAVSLTGGKATAATVGDVLNIINNAPSNLASGTALVARLATVGNGIELVDGSVGAGTLKVSGAPSNAASLDLGLIPNGQAGSSTPVTSGGNQILTGVDTNPIEVHGAFNALLRLRDALTSGDATAIQRAIGLLDEVGDKVTAARAEVGVRGQSVDLFLSQLQDQNVDLQKAQSNDLDIDMADTITQLTQSQTSFQAALQSAGMISKLSLLDYL